MADDLSVSAEAQATKPKEPEGGDSKERVTRRAESDRVAMARIQAWQTVLISMVRGATVVGVSYYLYKAAEALAGKTTSFTTVLNAVANMSLDRWAAWLLAGVFGVGYVRERKLRQRTIAGTSEYTKSLEKKVDPKRSSSGLTNRGTPPKNQTNNKPKRKRR